MGPAIGRFLKSVARLAKNKDITINEVYDFAKREFGEVSDLLKIQINRIFKQSDAPSIKKPEKPGEVIQLPKKETPVQEPGTSPVMQRLEKGIETLKEMKQPGMDLTTGLTKTIARSILNKKGIQVPERVDPIEVLTQNFGADVLMDAKNVAEELIELQRMGKSTKSIDEVLEQEGMFDIQINKDAPKGMSDEQLQEIKKQVDQEKMFKDFDPTDRKPNSEGGINRTMYAVGSGVKLAKYLSRKGKNLKEEIKKAVDNIFTTDDIKYDADVALDTMFEELGVDRDMFDQKDILDAYGMAYDELKIPLLQSLKNKPVKSMESMKKTGSIDISDPEIAGEMDRFAKQNDPEGYKKMEEAMKKAADEAQPVDYALGLRKKNSKGGLQSLMERKSYYLGGEVAYDATDPIYGSSAITVTPDTVMGPGGNQIQDQMGKPGMVSPITGMPIPPENLAPAPPNSGSGLGPGGVTLRPGGPSSPYIPPPGIDLPGNLGTPMGPGGDINSILGDYRNSDFYSKIGTADVRPFTFGGEEMSGSSTYIGGLRNYLDSIGKSDLLQLPEPQTASLQKQQPLSPLAGTAYFSKGGSAKRGIDYLMGM